MTTYLPAAAPASAALPEAARPLRLEVFSHERAHPGALEGVPEKDLGEGAGAASAPGSKGGVQGVRRASRREEIVVGASEMFAEHGYDGASLRGIATHVGISHPGMLHHFSTKEALLSASIDGLEAHAQAALDHVEDSGASPAAFQRALGDWWDPSSGVIQLLARLDADSTSRRHPGRFRIGRLRRVHEHILETCFAALKERHLVKVDIDPAFASRALVASALSSAIRENTVRAMQRCDHGDTPLCDLRRLTRQFLHATAPSA